MSPDVGLHAHRQQFVYGLAGGQLLAQLRGRQRNGRHPEEHDVAGGRVGQRVRAARRQQLLDVGRQVGQGDTLALRHGQVGVIQQVLPVMPGVEVAELVAAQHQDQRVVGAVVLPQGFQRVDRVLLLHVFLPLHQR